MQRRDKMRKGGNSVEKGLKRGKKNKTWIRDKALNIFTSSFFTITINSNHYFNAHYLQKVNLFHHSYLKGGNRRVCIFSAHNKWWATPEVRLPLLYQRSAKV